MFGEMLRQVREERGLSLRDLAYESGLTASALSLIERDLRYPSLRTVEALAKALRITVTVRHTGRVVVTRVA